MRYLYRNRLLDAICDAGCATELPEYLTNNCIPARLRGGIVQVIISTCDVDWSDENVIDVDFWNTTKTAGDVMGTARTKGGGFNVTEVTEDTDACRTPEVTGRTWSVTVKDFNVDLTGGLDVTFWDTMLQSINGFQVMFRTGENYTWGFFPLRINSKPTIPDTCDSLFFRELTFTWKSINEPTRRYLSFLSTVFPI